MEWTSLRAVSCGRDGYLFGQYRKITNRHESGMFTGKGVQWGGAEVRTEATGYGAVYFAQEMLAVHGDSFEGKRVGVGLLRQVKEVDRARISAYAKQRPGARFVEGARPWAVPVDIAIPSATQNELDEADARALVANGVRAVAEGANMPSTPGAVSLFQDAGVLFGPGKAANAGGVATSALEMSQNAARQRWSFADSEAKLRTIMQGVHDSAFEAAERYGRPGDYVVGANSAGFERVAHAMLAQGVI